MKALAATLALAALLALAAPPAFAQSWTGQRIGNFTYWNGPGGTVTCQRIGQFTYCN